MTITKGKATSGVASIFTSKLLVNCRVKFELVRDSYFTRLTVQNKSMINAQSKFDLIVKKQTVKNKLKFTDRAFS